MARCHALSIPSIHAAKHARKTAPYSAAMPERKVPRPGKADRRNPAAERIHPQNPNSQSSAQLSSITCRSGAE